MISTATVATAIVSKLKADTAVAALAKSGEEIREESWMGTDYNYPCYRIHVTRLTPIGEPGSCEDTGFDCDFNISYRAVNPSSKSTADGIAVATGVLVGKKLNGAGFVGRSAVKLADVAGPIPEAENTWMARAFFNCRLQEI
jgi:hypothetical protein